MVAPMFGLVAALFTRMSSGAELLDGRGHTGRGLVGVAGVGGEGGRPARPDVAARIAAAASSSPSCLRDDSITAAPAVGQRRGDRPPDALRRAR